MTSVTRKKTKLGKIAPRHGLWSANWVFVMAAAMAAIGLSNFWQIPHMAAQYGGGAFILVYSIFLLLIAFPLMIAEVIMGRVGRHSPINTLATLSSQLKINRRWSLVGWLAIITCLLLLSSLSIIGGWTIAYFLRFVAGVFVTLTESGINSIFFRFAEDPEKQLFWHSLFVIMTTVAVARGLRTGLEPLIKVLAPLLFVLLFILLVYAAIVGDITGAVSRILFPDFSKLTLKGVISAVVLAFFSLSVGIGVMLTYGALLRDDANIPRLSLITVGLDIITTIIAGIIIFAILLTVDIVPGSNIELIFRQIPYGLEELPYGQLMGSVFFAALVIVTWLTGVALIGPAVTYVVERWEARRFNAAIYCGLAVWLFGIILILSLNYWKFSFTLFGAVKKLGLLSIVQLLTANVLMPLSAVLIAVYAGWVIKRNVTRELVEFRSDCTHEIWLWSVRLVAPLLLVVILFNTYSLFL